MQLLMPLVFMTSLALAGVLGAALLRAARVTLTDPIANAGVSMSLGLCVFPLIALWTRFLPWGVWPARVLFVAAAAVAIRPHGVRNLRRWVACARGRWLFVTASLVIVAVALSLWQVSAATVAPGVDSVHHIMLTRLFVMGGGIPATLDPFIEQGRLVYHWGAHANVAVVAWILGRADAFDISAAIVAHSAALRFICSLSVYAAARSLFRYRSAAILAAAITACVSALPGALVTQGRFTQLAGVTILPVILSISRWRSAPLRSALVFSVAAAGIFLIQARVFLFAVSWLVVIAFLLRGDRLRRIGAAGLALLLTVALCGPWLSHLLRDELATDMLLGRGFAQQENRWTQRVVPEQMIWLRHSGLLLSLATMGVSGVAGLGVTGAARFLSAAWFILLLVVLRRRRTVVPWHAFVALATWVALSAAALAFRYQGADVTNVVPYAAAVLTLWLPVVLLSAGVASIVVESSGRGVRAAMVMVLVGLSAGTGIAGASADRIRSPVAEADLEGMRWIRSNTSPAARFAVIAEPFYGIYVGHDSGYWIHVLTDRRSILPPMIYGWCQPASQVAKTNEQLRVWTTVHPQQSVDFLIAAGFTHAYIGSAADPFAASFMRQSEHFRVVYDTDGVVISELRTGR